MDVVWAAETAGDGGGSGYWQLAMVLLAIGLLTAFGRWRKSRAPNAGFAKVKELRDRDREPHRHRDAADQAIVEMLEMSRTLNAQIDTKIRILNRLVKDAEDKTAALRKLLSETGACMEKSEPRPENAHPRAANDNGYQSDLHERIHRLREQGKTTVEIAKATNLSTTEVNFVLSRIGIDRNDES
jgi:hypothetical protein